MDSHSLPTLFPMENAPLNRLGLPAGEQGLWPREAEPIHFWRRLWGHQRPSPGTPCPTSEWLLPSTPPPCPAFPMKIGRGDPDRIISSLMGSFSLRFAGKLFWRSGRLRDESQSGLDLRPALDPACRLASGVHGARSAGTRGWEAPFPPLSLSQGGVPVVPPSPSHLPSGRGRSWTVAGGRPG